jgi:hypothetical protein
LAANSFQIQVTTINGQRQDKPVLTSFPCGGVIPVGEAIIKDYDANFCIVAQKVFLFRVGNNVFGTQVVKTKAEFEQYVGTHCRGGLLINGCFVEINHHFIHSV